MRAGCPLIQQTRLFGAHCASYRDNIIREFDTLPGHLWLPGSFPRAALFQGNRFFPELNASVDCILQTRAVELLGGVISSELAKLFKDYRNLGDAALILGQRVVIAIENVDEASASSRRDIGLGFPKQLPYLLRVIDPAFAVSEIGKRAIDQNCTNQQQPYRDRKRVSCSDAGRHVQLVETPVLRRTGDKVEKASVDFQQCSRIRPVANRFPTVCCRTFPK